MAVADANNDGILDLLAVQADGAIIRISDKNEGQSWETAEIASVPNAGSYLAGEVRLHVADLDNNGALDLFLSPTTPTPDATLQVRWSGSATQRQLHAADSSRRTGVGLRRCRSRQRRPSRSSRSFGGWATGAGRQSEPKNYHWQVVRPHAVQAVGDQRINPFGVGGEIEIRSGLLVQKQPITGPQLHFGSGRADRGRCGAGRLAEWHGARRVRSESRSGSGDRAAPEGFCPFLFAYNGKEMEFVKDAVPWGSAIGLRINTLGSAQIAATGEWYKIGRDQLVPHDGFYDIRVTAELWEVYYYDYLALMTVDHPAGTEIFVDERFVIPPAKLGITTVATPHNIAHAMDDNGHDVTDLVSTLDGKAVEQLRARAVPGRDARSLSRSRSGR